MICCCCYLCLIMVDFKTTSFNQFTIFIFPLLQAEGNSRCCSASLNPLTVCFHTKLIKDFLNREHAMKEKSHLGFSVFLLYSAKYLVYSVISAFPTAEEFKDKYDLLNRLVFQINRWLPLIKYLFFSNICQLFQITKVLHGVKSDFLSRQNGGGSPRDRKRGKLLFHHIPFLLNQLDICNKLSLHCRSVNVC